VHNLGLRSRTVVSGLIH